MSNLHNVLIVGTGSIGERHLRCFQTTGRATVSFVEINEELRKTIAERYQARGFPTLDAALTEHNKAKPDAPERFKVAVVATPANHHLAMSTRLAEAGIHILIEKPLSTGTVGVDRLTSEVREKKVLAGLAYVYRSLPALTEMRRAIESGRFGKPVEIVAVCGQNFPTYRPAYRETYYVKRATGGGAIQDALTHVLNAGEWLVGPIDRLVTDAAHQILEGVEVEDTVHVLTRHGSVLGSYALNQHQAPNEVTITVVCEHGTVRYESHASRWRWMMQPDEPWHDEPQEPLTRDAPFIIQAHKFLDAVDGIAPLLCPLAEGVQTLRVNLAALKSLDEGAWQTVRRSGANS